MLLVVEDQFEAAIQELYRESGTMISLVVKVLENAFTLASVGTDIARLKSNTLHLLAE